MSRRFIGLIALAFAVSITAYATISEKIAKYANIDFHYNKPNLGTETLYEMSSSWTANPSAPTCNNGANPCVLRIDQNKLTPYSGTNEQKLASYLAAQVGGGTDFGSAVAAVNALRISTKPVGQ